MARESFFCFSMVCPAGIEPAAYSLGGCRSIRLSYGHMGWFAVRFCLIRARGRVKSILVQGRLRARTQAELARRGYPNTAAGKKPARPRITAARSKKATHLNRANLREARRALTIIWAIMQRSRGEISFSSAR